MISAKKAAVRVTFVMPIYLRVLELHVGSPTCSAMALLSHRQGWSLAVLLSIFPCIFSATSTNDAPSITYRTGTSEVRVAFFATDEHDQLVPDLSRDDFAIVDSGVVIREFRSLARSHETALDVVVLVDASQSVEQRFSSTLQIVRHLVLETPFSSADRLSIVTFAGLQSQTVCAGDCGTSSAARKLEIIKADGPTPLYDALTGVAKELPARYKPDVRQVLILISDGNDTISGSSARECLALIMGSGAILYAVNVNPDRAATAALTEIADATGGRVLSRGEPDVLDEILAEQRASYVVSYALPLAQKGFHPLRILPKHNLNLQFHCRRGYYYDDVR